MLPETLAQGRSNGESWFERSGLKNLLKTPRLLFSPAVILPAFLGLAATFFVGFALDAIWPTTSRPIIGSGFGESSELDQYLVARGNALAVTREWGAEQARLPDVKRGGIFDLLLLHATRTGNAIIESVFRLDPKALAESVARGYAGVAWLFGMHPVYGILYSILKLVIWAFFGGAICRGAALRFAREENPSLWDVLRFSRQRWFTFVAAPLIPLGVLFFIAFLLFVAGLFGAIPWIGELAVGLGFMIPILAGLAAAVVFIGGMLICPLLAPGISVDDLDPGDAVATAGNLVVERPWKYISFMLMALVYGAFCLWLIKLVVALGLWLASASLGASMNWGNAATIGAGGANNSVDDKLTAMWQAPRPGDNRPFYGTFDGPTLRFPSSWAQRGIRAWIFVLWG
ncbi:MAG TPA: hypothetical protein VNT79_17840, partial [Phycisphaerae bacterium]|nr:hypothetical protein [Phycisphaerae bacterium]